MTQRYTPADLLEIMRLFLRVHVVASVEELPRFTPSLHSILSHHDGEDYWIVDSQIESKIEHEVGRLAFWLASGRVGRINFDMDNHSTPIRCARRKGLDLWPPLRRLCPSRGGYFRQDAGLAGDFGDPGEAMACGVEAAIAKRNGETTEAALDRLLDYGYDPHHVPTILAGGEQLLRWLEEEVAMRQLAAVGAPTASAGPA
jgi:hypothetical protein